MKNCLLILLFFSLLHGMTLQSEAQFELGTEFSSVEEAFVATPVDEVRAIYNPINGEVTLTIKGDAVLVLGLEGAPFNLENLNADTPLGEFEQADENGIGQLSFSGLPAGIFNVGSILPPNPNIRTAAQLAMIYPDLVVRNGGAGRPESRSQLDVLIAIPEPCSTFVIAGLGMMACVKRRRFLG